MNISQLQELYTQRVDGESINETLKRVKDTHSTNDIQGTGKIIDVSYDEELPIPRLKLVQPSSRISGATEGHYRNTVTEEEFKTLELIFLVQQNSRTLFPQNDFSGNKKCWSYNGYHPSEDVRERTGKNPVANQCATHENGKPKFTCPMAHWCNDLGEPDTNGRVQPKCKPTISMLAVMRDSLLPCWLTFHGSAIPEVKQFLKFVKYKKEEMKRKGVALNLYDFSVKLELELITNTRGKFYVPRFVKKEKVACPQEKSLLHRCYNELHGRLLSDPLEEESSSS